MVNKTSAYLGLGSSMGDRVALLKNAIALLSDHSHITILKSSSIYETTPWPKNETSTQNWFLNQVIHIQTSLSPHDLLRVTEDIEKAVGPKKKGDWGPRLIDIDILLYGSQIIDLPDLQIPHPRMNERQFVLVPLMEITPELQDPVSGRKFSDLLKELQKNDESEVKLRST